MTSTPSNSRATTVWPADIPRAERLPLDVGHGSFFLHRLHVEKEACNGQKVRLTCNLLIVVRRGSAILESNETVELLQESDCALVPPGEFQLTEISRRNKSHGEILFFFFNQAALGCLMQDKGELDQIAARISLPALPFYPVRNFGVSLDAALAAKKLRGYAEFTRLFNGLIGWGQGHLFAFLKHRYFVHRLKLDLFLESNILGNPNVKDLEKRYPDGARAFRCECAIYLGMTVSQWYTRRRTELAYMWIRFGNHKLEEIASLLGFRDLRVLRENVARYAGIPVQAITSLDKVSSSKNIRYLCTPFWVPSFEAREAKQYDREGTLENKMRGMTEEEIEEYNYIMFGISSRSHLGIARETVAPVAETDPSFENFLALKTTFSDKIISLDAIESWETGNVALFTEEFEKMAA